MATRVARHADISTDGCAVLDGDNTAVAGNEGGRQLRLGLGEVAKQRSDRDVKHCRRTRRWLS